MVIWNTRNVRFRDDREKDRDVDQRLSVIANFSGDHDGDVVKDTDVAWNTSRGQAEWNYRMVWPVMLPCKLPRLKIQVLLLLPPLRPALSPTAGARRCGTTPSSTTAPKWASACTTSSPSSTPPSAPRRPSTRTPAHGGSRSRSAPPRAARAAPLTHARAATAPELQRSAGPGVGSVLPRGCGRGGAEPRGRGPEGAQPQPVPALADAQPSPVGRGHARPRLAAVTAVMSRAALRARQPQPNLSCACVFAIFVCVWVSVPMWQGFIVAVPFVQQMRHNRLCVHHPSGHCAALRHHQPRKFRFLTGPSLLSFAFCAPSSATHNSICPFATCPTATIATAPWKSCAGS
jgi:hypothetical protein